MFSLTGGNGQALSGGMVELNLGGENLFTLGQNGTDVSAGMLYTAYQGLDAYKQNSRIWEKGLEGDLATAMKTAYSNGSAEGRRLYEEVLAGTTYVTMDESLQGDGLTERDRETGARVVRLRGGKGKNSDLQLGVTLSHEAYRNGYDDGEAGQRIETNRAVMGHIGAAGQIGAIYGEGVLREDMKAEVEKLRAAQASGDFTALAKYIGATYDSSGDNWKLISRKDGTNVVIWDGQRDLTVEYQDEDQNGNWETVKEVKVALGEKTYGASLFQAVGVERAYEMLTPYELDQLKNVPKEQLAMKAGEMIMEKMGMSYTDKAGWVGGEHFGMTITSGDTAPGGYVLFNRDAKRNLERFTVEAALDRKWESWDSVLGPGKDPTDPVNKKALDTLTYTKRDLKGNTLAQVIMTGVQSVDVYDRVDIGDGVTNRRQSYYSNWLGKVIEGNTIASDFSMTYNQGNTKNYTTIHNARTVDGDWINKLGTDNEPGGNWYNHGGAPYQTSDGCPIVPNAMTQTYYEQLRRLNMPNGGQIRGQLNDYRLFLIDLFGGRKVGK